MPEQDSGHATAASVAPSAGITADHQPPDVSAGGSYRTGRPVTARPMIMRWISLVPSKIVKIVELAAVSAGQRPVTPSGISTNSARPVRDESGFRPAVARCPSGSARVGRALRTRQIPSPTRHSAVGTLEIHFCADLPVSLTDDVRPCGPTARTGRKRPGRPRSARKTRADRLLPPTRRRYGPDRP
jgi:hypothetical protein